MMRKEAGTVISTSGYRAWWLVAAAAMCILCLAGCQEPKRSRASLLWLPPQTTPDSTRVAPAEPHEPDAAEVPYRRFEMSRSIENRPIECEILGQGKDVVLILATIHGDEPAGTPLARALVRHLKAHPRLLVNRQVLVIHTANPDGRAHNTRQNARNVDLNRNFPASNFSAERDHGARALSEPESRALLALLTTYEPRRIVSIHQPLNCIDYDGPADELAQRMGEYCDLPVRKLGSRPGSLGSYAGLTLKTPIVTVELPRNAHRLPATTLWEQYGDMLLTAVCYPGAVPPDATALASSETRVRSTPPAK
jgi:protein MpaA